MCAPCLRFLAPTTARTAGRGVEQRGVARGTQGAPQGRACTQRRTAGRACFARKCADVQSCGKKQPISLAPSVRAPCDARALGRVRVQGGAACGVRALQHTHRERASGRCTPSSLQHTQAEAGRPRRARYRRARAMKFGRRLEEALPAALAPYTLPYAVRGARRGAAGRPAHGCGVLWQAETVCFLAVLRAARRCAHAHAPRIARARAPAGGALRGGRGARRVPRGGVGAAAPACARAACRTFHRTRLAACGVAPALRRPLCPEALHACVCARAPHARVADAPRAPMCAFTVRRSPLFSFFLATAPRSRVPLASRRHRRR
jgi:hypothetical protein